MVVPGDRLLRIQALSGLTFLLFVLVHDVNTLVAVGGEQAYDGYQGSARMRKNPRDVDAEIFISQGWAIPRMSPAPSTGCHDTPSEPCSTR